MFDVRRPKAARLGTLCKGIHGTQSVAVHVPVAAVRGDGVDERVVVEGRQVGVLGLCRFSGGRTCDGTVNVGVPTRQRKPNAVREAKASLETAIKHDSERGARLERSIPAAASQAARIEHTQDMTASSWAHLDVHDLREVVHAQPHLARAVVVQVGEGHLRKSRRWQESDCTERTHQSQLC